MAREPARLSGPGCCCCWSLGNHSVRPVNSTLFVHRAPQPGPRFGLETGFWGALRKGFLKPNVEVICFWRLLWHEPRRVCSWYPFSEVEVSHGGFNKNTCRGLYSPAEAAVLAQQSLNFSVLEVRAEITLPRPNKPSSSRALTLSRVSPATCLAPQPLHPSLRCHRVQGRWGLASLVWRLHP